MKLKLFTHLHPVGTGRGRQGREYAARGENSGTRVYWLENRVFGYAGDEVKARSCKVIGGFASC